MTMDQQRSPMPPEERPAPAEPASPSVRLQILSTEHWSLLATRSLTWNESFARAQMFLSVLSAAVVALALVAQATQFGEGFEVFALVILPVVCFLGVASFVRLVAANNDEARWVVGMNRIRAKYLELAPELEEVFVTGHTDDARGLMVTGGWADFPTLFGLVTTPAVVGIVDGVVAAVLVFIAADLALGHAMPLAAGLLGGAAFVAWVAGVRTYIVRDRRRSTRMPHPIYPSPPEG